MSDLTKLEDTPLSIDQMQKYLKDHGMKPNIAMFSHMDEYTTLEELLGKENYVVLFLATNAQNIGHWECAFADHGRFFFFDSYGKNCTELINKVNSVNGKIMFNQRPELLPLLIKNSQYSNSAYMNKFDYQNKSDEKMATCGDHCLSVLTVWQKMVKNNQPFDFAKYYEAITQIMEKGQFPDYDATVAEIVHNQI